MLARIKALTPELNGLSVTLDGVTHLGRGGVIQKHGQDSPVDFFDQTGRARPGKFNEARIVVQIDGERNQVSRNHALLFPEEERYYLRDLHSANGTTLNGIKIGGGIDQLLTEGDLIVLAPGCDKGVEFQFNYFPKTSEDQNFALLVGNSGYNLQGVQPDILEMKRLLSLRKGFGGNIITLLEEEATQRRVLDQLENIQRQATDNSLTVFHYSGHGEENMGLNLRDNVLSPERLYNTIDQIRGKKLIILDACYAGQFCDQSLVPEHSLIMAATTKDAVAYEGKHDSNEAFRRMGHFSRALERIFESTPDRIDLKRLDELKEDYYLVSKGQKPLVTGFTIFLPSIAGMNALKE
ncbi:MAG: caspase family protein [Candidatus Woesearchaeota archaeon]